MLNLKMDKYHNIKKLLIWVIYDFSGLRFISEKIVPPKSIENKRKASTFIFWFVGTYVALFGIASQRYENRIDIIENRANAVFSQLSTEAKDYAITRIPYVQNMLTPKKPDFLKPMTTIKSLLGKEVRYDEMSELLIDTIVGNKRALKGLDLSGIDLHNVDLRGANIKETTLKNSNLSNTNLTSLNLSKTNMKNAEMVGAILDKAGIGYTILIKANMENSSLADAHSLYSDFTGANLKDADFTNTHFYSCDFTNATGLTVKQICRSKKFLKSKGISAILEKEIQETCPQVLIEPSAEKKE